jgi:hypothetical protein
MEILVIGVDGHAFSREVANTACRKGLLPALTDDQSTQSDYDHYF